MQDNWLNHNTDKLILLILFVGVWISCILCAVHIFHHDSDSMQAIAFISFMTGAVSTVLGALVMILTGRTNRADGQTGNGMPAGCRRRQHRKANKSHRGTLMATIPIPAPDDNKIRFDKSVSLGTVMQIIILLVTVAMAWSTLSRAAEYFPGEATGTATADCGSGIAARL